MTLPPIKPSNIRNLTSTRRTSTNHTPTLPPILSIFSPKIGAPNRITESPLPVLITQPGTYKSSLKAFQVLDEIIPINTEASSSSSSSDVWRNRFSSQVLPQVLNMGPLTRYRHDNLEKLKSLESRMEFSEWSNPYLSKNTINTDISNNTAEPSNFTVAMVPNLWKMINSFKAQSDKSFFMSDVIAIVYNKFAKKYHFFGCLPNAIMRCNISNVKTLDLINSTEEQVVKNKMTRKTQFSLFMTQTDNGKSSKNVLDAFGLEAYEMAWDGENVILLVRRKHLF